MRLRWLLLLPLAGCPGPNQYLVADVTAHHVPVEGALVTAQCGEYRSVRRTDDTGRARLMLPGDADAARCDVTIAAPQLPTFEAYGASLCTAPNACPPLAVEMLGDMFGWSQREYSRAPEVVR
jgi:hypothetical protein